MSNRFRLQLDMLKESFSNPVSENDYHEIVGCLRDYSTNRCDPTIEAHELREHGFPSDYHPCDHLERIRFAMTFNSKDNTRIRELINAY